MRKCAASFCSPQMICTFCVLCVLTRNASIEHWCCCGRASYSRNRSIPTGFKVVFIPLDATGRITGPAQDYATGWLANNDIAAGHSVGLAVDPDGALYVSDDKAGMIYRITWTQHP
ncbi:MAG TPA: hypothetical protein VF026_20350 [Ktedonobacteraceae bacterium]